MPSVCIQVINAQIQAALTVFQSRYSFPYHFPITSQLWEDYTIANLSWNQHSLINVHCAGRQNRRRLPVRRYASNHSYHDRRKNWCLCAHNQHNHFGNCLGPLIAADLRLGLARMPLLQWMWWLEKSLHGYVSPTSKPMTWIRRRLIEVSSKEGVT